MKLCRVINPGLSTTVQDLGRVGFQRYGVPVSGAMDTYALMAANLLVGNQPNEACLETTLLGPELEFLNQAQIAITGAALSSTINGKSVPCWQTLQVCRGDVLSFGYLKNGCRAYLAVRRGFDVPPVLGSKSTYVRGGFGGLEGRPLRAGDIIGTCQAGKPLKSGYSMPKELIPSYSSELKVEVVLGPQSDFFTDRGLETFLSGVYTVTVESDRMGYRLEGPEVEQKEFLDMVSDAVPVGSVQVPRNGEPIIVMKDAQTTGGYPKIAVVATPDISLLGQAKPNHKIRFSKVSFRQARVKILEYLKTLRQMKKRLEKSEL